MVENDRSHSADVTNDLPYCFKHLTPGLLADDTNIAVAGRDISVIENLLNEDLQQVRKWLTTN